MANKQERSIKISQDMMEILEDMVSDGGATSVEEALENIFTDWIVQVSIDAETEQMGVVVVNSGTVVIADPCFKDRIPEPIRCSDANKLMTGFATPHGDGVFPVYKEEWDDVVRVVIEFPKLQFGALEGEEVEDQN